MTIKELAYSTQQHLKTSTGADFKRAHIYKLLAASFGFNSYAALGAEAVFTDLPPCTRPSDRYREQVQSRCIEIGYQPEVARVVASIFPAFLLEREIGVTKISDLIAYLRLESGQQIWDGDEAADRDDDQDEWTTGSEIRESAILIDGLSTVASKGNALAHYALALIHAPVEEDEGQEVGSEYWYSQAQEGRVLSGVDKEWADAYSAHLARVEKYSRHLQEAARLGQQDALLDLADRFDDPAFFELADTQVNADPILVAEIAERLGRPNDARKWLTAAAETGDTKAMRQLIDGYDRGDLQKSWTWVYLAELFGEDLTKDAHYAIHEDGSPYDDDVGGNAFVGGRDGVHIDPLGAEQAAIARRTAQEIFQRIE
jgi:hypothetical protein